MAASNALDILEEDELTTVIAVENFHVQLLASRVPFVVTVQGDVKRNSDEGFGGSDSSSFRIVHQTLLPRYYFGVPTMRSFLAVIGAWFLFASSASAWNEFGHMAVARVAYREMDDGLKVRVAKLIQEHPHYKDHLSNLCPADVPVAEWAFLRAATWSDWIRPKKDDPRGDRVTGYHRPGDHYVNMPIVPDGYLDVFRDLKADPDVQDIVGAFKQRITEVKLRSATKADRAVAICWMSHLIGDVHQPLHCGTLFSSIFPDGDLGGNRFGVTVEGKGVKLHAFWDDALGKAEGWESDSASRQAKLYERLKEIDETLRDPKYGRDKLQELGKSTTFPSWVRESHELAVRVGYREGKLRGAVVSFNAPVPTDAPSLSVEYVATAKELAKVRIVLAGYRLADKLKEALPKD